MAPRLIVAATGAAVLAASPLGAAADGGDRTASTKLAKAFLRGAKHAAAPAAHDDLKFSPKQLEEADHVVRSRSMAEELGMVQIAPGVFMRELSAEAPKHLLERGMMTEHGSEAYATQIEKLRQLKTDHARTQAHAEHQVTQQEKLALLQTSQKSGSRSKLPGGEGAIAFFPDEEGDADVCSEKNPKSAVFSPLSNLPRYLHDNDLCDTLPIAAVQSGSSASCNDGWTAGLSFRGSTKTSSGGDLLRFLASEGNESTLGNTPMTSGKNPLAKWHTNCLKTGGAGPDTNICYDLATGSMFGGGNTDNAEVQSTAGAATLSAGSGAFHFANCGGQYALNAFVNEQCFAGQTLISNSLSSRLNRAVGTCNASNMECVHAFATYGNLKTDSYVFPYQWASYAVTPCNAKVATITPAAWNGEYRVSPEAFAEAGHGYSAEKGWAAPVNREKAAKVKPDFAYYKTCYGAAADTQVSISNACMREDRNHSISNQNNFPSEEDQFSAGL